MRKKNVFRYMVLLVCFLYMILILGSCVYVAWNANAPTHINVLFPEDTQIIRKTDTHKGFFRSRGTAVTVVQIPQEFIQAFGNHLVEVGFWDGHPYDEPRQRLETIPEAKPALESNNILWTYEDEAFALIEEPYSDYFAAIYDLESGLLCYVEYDE